MSLNNLHLNTNDLVQLYKDKLVEVDNTEPTAVTSEIEWKFLGENKKRTLIIVKNDKAVHIPDTQLSFLIKLLSACNLSIGDVAIINLRTNKHAEINNLFQFFNPKSVLLFGVDPKELEMPLLFPNFQVQSHKDSYFISSPSLDEIEPDKTLKGKLWLCLKKIYNL